MHPPLDRPHPECEQQVADLRECHKKSWAKYLGQCNAAKFALDRCFKAEKKHLLDELNRNVPEQRREQEEAIKTAFGKKETFAEYLARDKDYLQAQQQKAASSKQQT